MDEVEQVVSQLVRQGAQDCGGGALRVLSDRMFYLFFEPGAAPPWLVEASLVSRRGESYV